MRILVIDGHPDAGRYGEAVARAYVEGAESGGHDVRVFRLREMHFDPILHGGFKKPQPLEPDLDDNATLYGKKLANSEIVTKGVRPPEAAAKLLELLNRYSAKERKN